MAPKWLKRQAELNGIGSAEDDYSVGIEAIQSFTDKRLKKKEDALEMISQALKLSSPYISRDGRGLWFQLHGRLKRAGECNKLIEQYMKRIERDAPKPGLLSLNEFLVEVCMKESLVEVIENRDIISFRSGVRCMSLLKGEERVACGCDNGDIAIFNIYRSEIEARWRAHEEAVISIDVGKDGKMIVSGSKDKIVKAWNARRGDCLLSFGGHVDSVMYVVMTEDEERVISGSEDGTVQVWHLASGSTVNAPIIVACDGYLLSIPHKYYKYYLLAVLKDEEHALMAREDGKLEIWNAVTNTKSGPPFSGHRSRVQCAELTLDERILVTGSWDGTVRLWDVETRQQVAAPLKGHTDCVRCVAISDDGHRLVSGSDDKTIRVWNPAIAEQIGEPLIGHTDSVTAVAFLGGGDTIVSCSCDRTIRRWNLKKKWKEVAVDKHHREVGGVSFCPNGTLIVSGSYDGTLEMWNASSGQAIGEPFQKDHCSLVYGVAVTPDERCVVSVSFKTVHLWDLQTRKIMRTFEGHTNRVSSVAVTPDGERAVTGSWDKSVRVWDLRSMDGSHFVFEGHKSAVEKVFVSDNGKRVISVDRRDDIIVWNIEMGMEMKKTKKENAKFMSRRQALGLINESTVHDEGGLSVPWRGKEIVHGEGNDRAILGTLESNIYDWAVSPDRQTVCVGLQNGQVGFIKLS